MSSVMAADSAIVLLDDVNLDGEIDMLDVLRLFKFVNEEIESLEG